MPTYEYQCAACGEHVEKFQKMSDEPLKICPHCGKPELQRQLSASGFQLKGTGWYVTDFRDKNKGEKPAEKKSEGSGVDEKKVDAKPAEEKKMAEPVKKTEDKKE